MSSQLDVIEFNKTVSKLVREAATADAVELNRILRELATVQADMQKVFTGGGNLADTVTRIEKRITTLEGVLVELLDSATPKAAARGAAIVDQGISVVGATIDVDVIDVTEGPLRTMRAIARQQSADLYTKLIYQVTRMTGPNPAPLDDVLAAIGSSLRGSIVFGGPTTRTAGAAGAVLGDVTGAATIARAEQSAERDGPRTLKRWVHAPGVKEPRSEHVKAASKYAAGIPWSQLFEVGSYRTPRPRGPGLPGPQRFGCRCSVAPVLSMEES